jgi:3-oxoadipate enol-lactonase/4-carboxymuconolactone decarboxylase
MAVFETETGTIYYEVHGVETARAPALTLLHNFMSSGRSAWGPMLDELGAHYRILLPDSPGHGRSQGYPESFDHRVMARQLAALMKAVGTDTGHLAGVSSGGMVAQQLVQQGLVNPKTLTLVSTTYSNNDQTTGVERSSRPENFKAGERWLEATARLHDPYHRSGYFNEVLLPAYNQLTPAQTIDLQLSDLALWTMPVCIIHGSEDEFFPQTIAENMAQAIPNSELHLIPDQPHALIFRRPWAITEIMLDFLQRNSSN